MQAPSRIIRPALVGTLFLLLGSACGGGGSGPSSGGSEIRVLFLNQTGRQLTITVDGPSFSPATVSAKTCSVGQGTCDTDEFPGVVGDVITFDVSSSGGAGQPISGSGNCRAGTGMVGIAPSPSGSEYGMVDFQYNGTSITIGCIYLWQ